MYFLDQIGLPLSIIMTLVFITCIAISLIAVLLTSAFRYVAQFFSIKGLGFWKVALISFSSSQYSWKGLSFAAEDNGPSIMKLLHFPRLFCHVCGVKVSFSWSTIRVEIESISVHLNSSLFVRDSCSPQKSRPKVVGFIAKLLPPFEVQCKRLQIYSSTGSFNNVKTLSILRCTISNILLSNKYDLAAQIETFNLDQLVATYNSLDITPVLSLTKLKAEMIDDICDLSFSGCAKLTFSVSFLFFLSSAIKDITKFNPEAEEVQSSHEPAKSASSEPILVRFSVPQIHIMFLLPETLSDTKIFCHLLFCLDNMSGSVFINEPLEPKFTVFANSFRASAKYESSHMECKYFCPIDRLLNRDFLFLADKVVDLLQLDNVSLSNWTNAPACNDRCTPISTELIQTLLSSILDKKVIWNTQTPAIGNFEFIQAYARQSDYFPNYDDYTSSSLFYRKLCPSVRTLFGHFDSVRAFVPFEFPFSNLLDHTIVLFKAGWRPLSRKTERGYWSGDGDKFLRNDWTLALKSKSIRIQFEDDQFEVRLSTIYHCHRKIADARVRLESALWEQIWTGNQDVDATEQLLADQLSVHKSKVPPQAVKPLIELNKALFEQYRELVRHSRLADSNNLIEATINDIELNVSWSLDYLRGKGLAELLNSIENGSNVNDEIVSRLATFLGGFFDVKTQHAQLSFRNFSRPVLLSPESRILGPLFLVEAPVRDPNVLVKFPVQVLPHSHMSNLIIPDNGVIDVLRSILPIKLYHCIHVAVSSTQLCQVSLSPFWMGCLGLVDRALDRFIKASTEDPSPPLPGWDKLRYNLLGIHSKISIAAPLLVSCIADSDPFISNELLEIAFPNGLDLSFTSKWHIELECYQATLGIKSVHLQNLNVAINGLESIATWDAECFNGAFKGFNVLPIIKLSRTHLQLRLDIKNLHGDIPCDHWNVFPVARENLPNTTDFVRFVLLPAANVSVIRVSLTHSRTSEVSLLPFI